MPLLWQSGVTASHDSRTMTTPQVDSASRGSCAASATPDIVQSLYCCFMRPPLLQLQLLRSLIHSYTQFQLPAIHHSLKRLLDAKLVGRPSHPHNDLCLVAGACRKDVTQCVISDGSVLRINAQPVHARCSDCFCDGWRAGGAHDAKAGVSLAAAAAAAAAVAAEAAAALCV